MPYPFYQGYQPTYQNYYPTNYQPYQQPVQQQTQPTPQYSQPQTVNQVQNGGFITVRSEEEARSYPVAPGTSVTFKHENAPYCYTKTMGFSQLEAPRFEKFRLVKEEEAPTTNDDSKDIEKPEYALKSDLGTVVGALKDLDGIVSAIKADVDCLKTDVYGLSGRKKAVKKPEAQDDE